MQQPKPWYTNPYLPFFTVTIICIAWLCSLEYDNLIYDNPYHPKCNSQEGAAICLAIIFAELIFVILIYNPLSYLPQRKIWLNIIAFVFCFLLGFVIMLLGLYIRDYTIVISGFWNLGVAIILIMHIAHGIHLKMKEPKTITPPEKQRVYIDESTLPEPEED